MYRNYLLLTAFLGLYLAIPLRASHILGGEIRMETTGEPNRFSFSMIQFWDQNQLTIANREPSVEILFYKKRDNQLVFRTTLRFVSSRNVEYPNQVCAGMRSLKTLEGTYTTQVTLNPADFSDPGGYYIVWERCCRNADVSNIRSPGGSGLVFYLEFPPLTLRNSSPVFTVPNGDYICLGLPYSINIAATDAEGDELRYSLVTPFRGNTDLDYPIGDDSPKSGYPLVEWLPGVSAQNMIPGNPSLAINSNTGKLSVTASQLGLYVFTVQCEEYRNGVRIGLVRRDFQSLVIECSPDSPPAPIIQYNQQPVSTLDLCSNQTIVLEVANAGDWLYQWQLNGKDIPGINAPTLAVNKAGGYSVTRSVNNTGQDQCSQPSRSETIQVGQGLGPSTLIRKSADVLCTGGTLQLGGPQNTSYSYQWRKGMNTLPESGPTINVLEAGMYVLVIKNAVNGCTATDSVEVTTESIRVTLPEQVEVERGQSVLLSPEITSTSSSLDYLWSPSLGLNTPAKPQTTAQPEQTTDYVLEIKTPGGCLATGRIKVVVKECKEVSIPQPVIVFRNQPVQEIELCREGTLLLEVKDAGDWSYQWTLDGQNIAGAMSANYAANRSGSYTVTRNSTKVAAGTCTQPIKSTELIVSAGKSPLAMINAESQVLCSGTSLLLRSDEVDPYKFIWSVNDRVLAETSSKIMISAPGKYRLDVLNEKNGCSASDSIQIREESVRMRVPAEILLKRGESVVLSPQVISSSLPVSYEWSPSLGLSNATDSFPVASPDQTTEYVLLTKTPGGCQAEGTIRITVIDRLYLPDAFSPNEDGINDVLVIQNGKELIETVQIYNRWGQIIFSEKGYTRPWDGHYNQALVETGIYPYVITTRDHIYKGAVRVLY